MRILDLWGGLGIFVNVWETFSIEAESTERLVTDENVWAFDSKVFIISTHMTRGHALELVTLNMLFSRITIKALGFKPEILQLTTHVWIGESPAVLGHWAFVFWQVYLLLTSICLLGASLLSLLFILLSYCGHKHRIMLSSFCASLWLSLNATITKYSGCHWPLRYRPCRPLLIWW